MLSRKKRKTFHHQGIFVEMFIKNFHERRGVFFLWHDIQNDELYILMDLKAQKEVNRREEKRNKNSNAIE